MVIMDMPEFTERQKEDAAAIPQGIRDAYKNYYEFEDYLRNHPGGSLVGHWAVATAKDVYVTMDLSDALDNLKARGLQSGEVITAQVAESDDPAEADASYFGSIEDDAD
jgi:hypothetical protein